jgi:predicted DNA-binding protein
MQLDKITSIRLFAGDTDKLQKIADSVGLEKADIIRSAVRAYIDNFNKTK